MKMRKPLVRNRNSDEMNNSKFKMRKLEIGNWKLAALLLVSIFHFLFSNFAFAGGPSLILAPAVGGHNYAADPPPTFYTANQVFTKVFNGSNAINVAVVSPGSPSTATGADQVLNASFNGSNALNVICLSGCGGSGGNPAFNSITSGTNTSAAMTLGTGATLNTSGSATIDFSGTSAAVKFNGSGFTNGDALKASVSGGALTLADAGSADVLLNATNTAGSNFTLNASAATGVNAIVVPNIAGCSPSAIGAHCFDTTNGTPVGYEQEGGQTTTKSTFTPLRAIGLSSTTPPAALDAGTITTTETALESAPFTFPANYFTSGKMARLHFILQEVTPTGTAVSFTYKLRGGSSCCGGTTVFSGHAETPTVNQTRSYEAVITIRCVGTGASGSFHVVPLGFGQGAGSISSSGSFFSNTVTQPVTLDTTAAETMYLTITFGGSTSGNNAQVLERWVEEVN